MHLLFELCKTWEVNEENFLSSLSLKWASQVFLSSWHTRIRIFWAHKIPGLSNQKCAIDNLRKTRVKSSLLWQNVKVEGFDPQLQQSLQSLPRQYSCWSPWNLTYPFFTHRSPPNFGFISSIHAERKDIISISLRNTKFKVMFPLGKRYSSTFCF